MWIPFFIDSNLFFLFSSSRFHQCICECVHKYVPVPEFPIFLFPFGDSFNIHIVFLLLKFFHMCFICRKIKWFFLDWKRFDDTQNLLVKKNLLDKKENKDAYDIGNRNFIICIQRKLNLFSFDREISFLTFQITNFILIHIRNAPGQNSNNKTEAVH